MQLPNFNVAQQEFYVAHKPRRFKVKIAYEGRSTNLSVTVTVT